MVKFDYMATFELEVSEAAELLAPGFDSVTAEIYDFDFQAQDVLSNMIGLTPVLVEKARQAALNQAVSYRGFWVGAAAYAYDTSPESPRIGIYTAGNFKAALGEAYDPACDVKDIPKNCAEMNILLTAEEDGFTRVGLLAVAATTNRKKIAEVTDVASRTLHPCRECGDVLQGSSLIDRRTVILTIGSGEDVYQAQTVGDYRTRYKRLHAGGVFEDAEEFPYRPHDWEIKQAAYHNAARKRRVSKVVKEGDIRKITLRRELAAWALTEA
jgi:hypothetical protein